MINQDEIVMFQLSVRIPQWLNDKLQMDADKVGITKSTHIRYLLGVPLPTPHMTATQNLQAIVGLHIQQDAAAGGLTTGICAECGTLWPCRTYHIAMDFGLGDECFANHWCSHVGVRVE